MEGAACRDGGIAYVARVAGAYDEVPDGADVGGIGLDAAPVGVVAGWVAGFAVVAGVGFGVARGVGVVRVPPPPTVGTPIENLTCGAV